MNHIGIGIILVSALLLVFYICTIMSEKYNYENVYHDYKIYKKGPQDSQIYVAKVRINKWVPRYKWYKADSNNEPKVFNSVHQLKIDLEASYESYIRNKNEKKEMKKLQRIE